MAHDFGTKSSVLHLDRGVPLPDTKSPMANTSAVWSWDLMLPRPSRVLVTNPDIQLPCHLLNTVLRAVCGREDPPLYYQLRPEGLSRERLDHGKSTGTWPEILQRKLPQSSRHRLHPPRRTQPFGKYPCPHRDWQRPDTGSGTQALYAKAPRLARGHEAFQHRPDHAALAC